MEISVGQVSGIIAAAIFFIQIVFPNALILILVGVLRNQHTAVTWSVAQRQLFSSLWPTFLRSDAAAGSGVNTSVRLISLLSPLGLALVALAAIVTPLGLYDAIVPSASDKSVPFLHLRDSGPFGSGTPPQNNSIAFTRVCNLNGFGIDSCPGSGNRVDLTKDDFDEVSAYEVIGRYNPNIPQSTIDLYQSGLKDFPETVSSFFDIRGRQYTSGYQRNINDEAPFRVSSFRMLDSMVLNNAIEPIQGLIVDTINGGVGFRNHTMPSGISEGAQWTEDLLFLEPVTECVNNNISIEFTYTGSFLDDSARNITLVDDGGFANLIQEYPELNMDDNQSNPKLKDRAYKAAWLTNVYNMLIMNVTRPNPDSFGYLNSHLGKRFNLSDDGTDGASLSGISSNTLFSRLVDPSANSLHNYTNSFTNQTELQGVYANPFNLTTSNFTDISILCEGVGGQDYANSSNLEVRCGVFYGAARRKDGVETLIFEPNTTWVRPVYTCASLSKASIKTVTFHYNATLGGDLKSLAITNITEKKYEKEADMPLWGIEQPDPVMTVQSIAQLWGLISEENAKTGNLSVKRAPELYLPGWSLSSGPIPGYSGIDYVPATTTPGQALGQMYTIGGASSDGIADYSGGNNLNMFQRWQELSGNETTIPRILNLVWTDVMANGVQGTRGWGYSDASAPGNKPVKRDSQPSNGGQTLVPVQIYSKRIQYHLLYAIPALLTLAMFALVVFGAFVFLLFGNGPGRVRHYLQHLSVGRLLAAQQYPGQSSVTAPTKLWTAQVGKYMVDIVHPHIVTGPTDYRGAQFPGQSPMMGAEKPAGVESYQLSNLAKVHQGYIPVAGGEHNMMR